jgi:N-acyl-D-aspartate/D-glutamate deacylase
MSAQFDLIIRGGTVADGTGRPLFEADIAIESGKIAGVGRITQSGREEIDAKGRLVTPGFVDIHTHYDGQAIWSKRLAPSSSHGVTSVVMGNCGVGFAPCRTNDRELLVSVMEGVEDIPEAVMARGLEWEWQSFPQYLDALERRSHDIDFATQIPHSALRVFAMGARGAAREAATSDDLATMQTPVAESLEAGALGFATSRLFIHRTGKGEHIPSYDAAENELEAIADVLGRARKGVLQFVLGVPGRSFQDEVRMAARLAQKSGRPASFSFAQDNQNPEGWRRTLAIVEEANLKGARMRAQIFPRPIGLVLGHNLSVSPFSLCPSYKAIAHLPLAERVARLRDPALRERLLLEPPGETTTPLATLGRIFTQMYPLGDPPDYEPDPSTSIAAQAKVRGVAPEALAYDLLLEQGGNAMLYVALTNYARGNLDAVLEMMQSGQTLLGLGDGGAHYGMICDAGYPTFLLAHWTRDRSGARLSIEEAVKALTREPSAAVGLNDRGAIAVGMKADLNVIDYDRLRVEKPGVAEDLPAGGRRLLQAAKGYAATIVSGEIIARDDTPTGALPGKLIRGAQAAP